MKLESLKKDKFESFRANEIQNKMKIVGGAEGDQATTFRNDKYHGTDVINVGTFGEDTPRPQFTLVNGRPGYVDFKKITNIKNEISEN